ncbi:hypothetical protein Tco_1106328 [Tanacetum coccineum]
MRKFMNKLKLLKRKIREWTKDKRANTNNNKKILKKQLAESIALLDKVKYVIVETHNNRADIFNLCRIDKLESIELAQKAKIKWGIEGDENTKYYHNRFGQPQSSRIQIAMDFPNHLSLEQQVDLESLRINIHKSKIMDISMSNDKVTQAAAKVDSSLWAKVIKGIHGEDGKIGKVVSNLHSSIWLDIVKEIDSLNQQGMNFLGYNNLGLSLRRIPRGGIEQSQLEALREFSDNTVLVDSMDMWSWSLEGSGNFLVSFSDMKKLIKNLLSDGFLQHPMG